MSTANGRDDPSDTIFPLKVAHDAGLDLRAAVLGFAHVVDRGARRARLGEPSYDPTELRANALP